MVESAGQGGMKKRMEEMTAFLEEQDTEIKEYDEALIRKMIEKVTVYEEKFVVEFKAGIEVEVRR